MSAKIAVSQAISRAQALAISPEYVAFAEGDFDAFGAVDEAFSKLKRGQKVITYIEGEGFTFAKVTSINHNDMRAIDGPVVRVGDQTATWRVDGDKYAYPAPE